MDPNQPPRWTENTDFDILMRRLYDDASLISPPPPPLRASAPKPAMNHVEAERFERHLLHSTAFELYDGDTLIFVDFPNPPEGVKYADCTGIAWTSQKLRISSKKLLATGSSKFAEMLGPTYQYRIIRRRKLVNQLPEGVKYVLDLTPPREGDELVFQMTELSLTSGLIHWWAAGQKRSVDHWVCRGHDDVCICWKSRKPDNPSIPPPDSAGSTAYDEPEDIDDQIMLDKAIRDTEPITNDVAETTTPGRSNGRATELLLKKERGDLQRLNIPDYRDIPDYCPIRHRVNILRLMMILADRRMLMDSAPRIWTLVGIAKIFDCTDAIRDQVLQWFMTPNNTAFLEILPEEALKIGFTLQFPDITRASFCILVNEMALEAAATTPKTRSGPTSVTIFGRRRQDPGDDLSNLIQHAARAMVERVSAMVTKIHSDTFFSDLQLPQWQRLMNIKNLLLQGAGDPSYDRAIEAVTDITSALLSLWRTEVVDHSFNKLLMHDVIESIDDDRAIYVEPRDFYRFDPTYHQFNRVQKALCPFVYQELATTWQKRPFFKAAHPLLIPKVNFYNMSQKLSALLQEISFLNPNHLDDTAWAAAMGKVDLFDPMACHAELSPYVSSIYSSWLRHDIEPPLNLTRHMLLNLEHNELKYLPLWAGGNNDGTGGVFEETLPPADYGPAGPGPAYHTGVTIPSDASSTTGSISSDLRGLYLYGSTNGPGSIDVQDGISTVYNRHRVVADDVSVRSEAFTEDGVDYNNARYEVPADNQSVAEAMNSMVLDEDHRATVGDDEDGITEIGAEDTVSGTQTPSVISIDDSDDDMVVV